MNAVCAVRHPLSPVALDGHAAIIGRTGSGKTTAAKGAVEGLLDLGRQVVVLDPTGSWWGLRLEPDGGKPAYPIPVLGGERGDLPLPPTCGETLAGAVVAGALSAVLDTSAMTVGERNRFHAAFLAALYQRNRAALHLVVDEAQEIAPQRAMPDQTAMLHHAQRLAGQGRRFGFRLLLITQRPAKLHKDVLSQAGVLATMQLTASQDRNALAAWIEGQGDPLEARALLDSLPRLETGEGWVWEPRVGPPRRVRFPASRTFDSGRAPAHGEGASAPAAPLAPAKALDALRAALESAAAPGGGGGGGAPAAAEAAALRRRVAELEADNARWKRLAEERGAAIEAVAAVLARAAPAGADAPPVPGPTAPRPPAPRRATANGGGLPGAAGPLLAALAQRSPAVLTWTQAATLAGLKARGGHFNAGRKALLDGGLVEASGQGVRATAAGIAGAGAVPAVPSDPAALLDLWCSRLPSPAPEMLRELARRGDAGATPTELASALGKQPRGGHWNGGVAMLRNNLLVEQEGGRFRAAAELRP